MAVNGDTQIILERLTVIETKQEERHRENQGVRKEMIKSLKPLMGVPTSIKFLTLSNGAIWIVIGSVIFIWVRIALAQ